MTKLYNRKEEKEIRRSLRRNQTYTEKVMWIHLRKKQVLGLKFKRQYSIGNFVIDFYCPEHKIAIELDGEIHNLDDVKTKDENRQKYLESLGVNFIRIENDEYLGNPNKAFEKIESEIKRIISLK